MRAYCWRTGLIGFGQRAPRGAIVIIKAKAQPLRKAIEGIARHAYNGRELLVPGIPEATNDTEAVQALNRFVSEVRKRVGISDRRDI